ncbi:MAG: hypothetical protein AAGA57_01420 [Planctomycetota bacterium]
MLIGELTVRRPGGGASRLTLDDRMTWRGDDPGLVELAKAACPGCTGAVSDAAAGRRLLFMAADRLGGRVRLAPPSEPLRLRDHGPKKAAERRPAFIRSA